METTFLSLEDLEDQVNALSEDTPENRINKTLLQMELKNLKLDLRNIERPAHEAP